MPERELELHRSVLRNAVYKAKASPAQLEASRWVSVVLRLHGGHKKYPSCILGLETQLDSKRQLQFRLALQVPGIPAHKLAPARFLRLEARPSESAVLEAVVGCEYLALGPLYRGLFSYGSFAQVVGTFFLRGIKVSLDDQLAPLVEWTGTCNAIHSFAHPSESLRLR